MSGMSVNEVPGWLVAMAPSAIGVPVAATPGLVPHCEVLTVAVLALAELVAFELVAGVLLVLLVLLLVLLLALLLQPAAAAMAIATAAASTRVLRADSRFRCVLIYPPQGGEFFQLS
jgi:hypothetical protein